LNESQLKFQQTKSFLSCNKLPKQCAVSKKAPENSGGFYEPSRRSWNTQSTTTTIQAMTCPPMRIR